MSMDEAKYKVAAKRIGERANSVSVALSQFVFLLVALFGGIVWLRTRADWPAVWPVTRPIVAMLLVLIGLQAVARITTDLMASWQLRQAETMLTHGTVPSPRFPRSCVQEIVFVAIVVLFTIGGVLLVRSLG